MPTWGQILKELNCSITEDRKTPNFDGIRRKYLKELYDYTKRPVIIYYSAFLESRPIAPNDLQINLQDMTGFMEAASDVDEKNLARLYNRDYKKDRFDLEHLNFHRNVAEGFRRIAKKNLNLKRCVLIDYEAGVNIVQDKLREEFSNRYLK